MAMRRLPTGLARLPGREGPTPWRQEASGRDHSTATGARPPLPDVRRRGEDPIRLVAESPGHDPRYAIDCSRAESELGWGPSVDSIVSLRIM